MTYQAPHEVREQEKLNSMITTLKNGGELPPVLVCGDRAYSGSHRLAAWAAVEIEPDVVEIDDDEYCKIVEALGMDPMYDSIYDFEQFLEMAQELGLAGDAK